MNSKDEREKVEDGESSVLTPARRQILRGATARILPSDDGPGAIEAGVPEYIEKTLGEASMRRYRRLMAYGLDLLDCLAREKKGRPFAGCDPEVQDALLTELQTSKTTADKLFFRKLVMLSLEGFLGDPARCGNRDRLGWKHIGFTSRVDSSSWEDENEGEQER